MNAIIKNMNNEDEKERMNAVNEFIEENPDDGLENLSLTLEKCEYEDVLFELLKYIAKIGCAITIDEEIESRVERAIYKIKDESKLIELANVNPCIDELIFTITALNCIEDKAALANLAKKAESYWIDADLVEEFKITDNDSLLDIAKNANIWTIAESAFYSLKYNLENDNSSKDFEYIFIDIAKNAKFPVVRKGAIEKINNQDVLIDIVKNDKNGIVRANALEKIEDPYYLSIDIANESINNMNLLKATVNKIEHKHVIEEIIHLTQDVLIEAHKKLDELKK